MLAQAVRAQEPLSRSEDRRADRQRHRCRAAVSAGVRDAPACGGARHAGKPEMTAANLKIARLLRQQAALAGFGGFAFRETDLGKILTEAARACAECLEVPFCKI